MKEIVFFTVLFVGVVAFSVGRASVPTTAPAKPDTTIVTRHDTTVVKIPCHIVSHKHGPNWPLN